MSPIVTACLPDRDVTSAFTLQSCVTFLTLFAKLLRKSVLFTFCRNDPSPPSPHLRNRRACCRFPGLRPTCGASAGCRRCRRRQKSQARPVRGVAEGTETNIRHPLMIVVRVDFVFDAVFTYRSKKPQMGTPTTNPRDLQRALDTPPLLVSRNCHLAKTLWIPTLSSMLPICNNVVHCPSFSGPRAFPCVPFLRSCAPNFHTRRGLRRHQCRLGVGNGVVGGGREPIGRRGSGWWLGG